MRRGYSLAIYLLIPLITAVTPLVAIPAISLSVGSDGWADIAIGQSFGMAAAIIGEVGWSVVGPQIVARAEGHQRLRIYHQAMASKMSMGAVLALIAGLLAAVMAQTLPYAAAFVGFATALSCLNSIWFFVGMNRPMMILLTDSFPRLLALVGAAAVLYLGGPIIAYPIGIFVGVFAAYLLAARAIRVRALPTIADFRTVPATLRGQAILMGGRAISSLYTALPIALVGIVSPQSVAGFAAAERLMRMGLNAVAAVPNRLQHWLGSSAPRELRERLIVSLWINLAVGIVSAATFVVAVPTAISILFAGTIVVEPLVLSFCAGVVLLVCVSRGAGLALVAISKAGTISVASLAAGVLGTACILLMAHLFGAAGGFLGEILAETTGLVVQGAVVARWIRAQK